jgi:hypothetical protein
MRALDDVVELARAYGNALILRDELHDELHSCSIETIVPGVNVFSEECGEEAAAAFVVAADVPIIWERWFTPGELGSDPETSWPPVHGELLNWAKMCCFSGFDTMPGWRDVLILSSSFI